MKGDDQMIFKEFTETDLFKISDVFECVDSNGSILDNDFVNADSLVIDWHVNYGYLEIVIGK